MFKSYLQKIVCHVTSNSILIGYIKKGVKLFSRLMPGLMQTRPAELVSGVLTRPAELVSVVQTRPAELVSAKKYLP
jgi:hypothetical protein